MRWNKIIALVVCVLCHGACRKRTVNSGLRDYAPAPDRSDAAWTLLAPLADREYLRAFMPGWGDDNGPSMPGNANSREAQRLYLNATWRQTTANLLEFYRADAGDRTEIHVEGFTAKGTVGPDGSIGPSLRVIKRLRTQLGADNYRDTYVIEVRPVADDGSIMLPTEIRTHYNAFVGARHVRDSFVLHIFDRFYPVYGPGGDVARLVRRWNGGTYRDEVGDTPIGCGNCHLTLITTVKAREFLQRGFPGESQEVRDRRLNDEAAVQDFMFTMPLDRHFAHDEYQEHFHKPAMRAPMADRRSYHIPGMVEVLARQLEAASYDILEPDPELRAEEVASTSADISYAKEGKTYADLVQLLMRDLWSGGTPNLPAQIPARGAAQSP